MTDDIDYDELEVQYENRNDSLRHAIDVISRYSDSDLEQWGKKSEIAEEYDIERHQIDYVLNHWSELVEWRRHCNRSPLDPEAVKAAYEDETLQAMADNQPAADGAGNISVNVEFTLDEAFRAVKLLPGDLGLRVYTQVLSSDFNREEVRAMLERD